MSKVFISYRRTDSDHAVGRLHDFLASKLSTGNIFLDIDSIVPGENFDEKIKATIRSCDTVLVIIGPNWNPNDENLTTARLDNPDDWVRKEVAAALTSGKKVIPVLIDDTQMPKVNSLPGELIPITKLNGARLRSGNDFSGDAQKILKAVGRSWFRPVLILAACLSLVVALGIGAYKLDFFKNDELNLNQVLLDGMLHPDKNVAAKHPNLIVNSRIIGEKYGLINDRPWRRRALVVSDESKREFFLPRAAVVRSRLYVLYLAKAWDDDTGYLYELMPGSGEPYLVDRLPYDGQGYWFDDEANMAVKGDYIYYLLSLGHSGKRYKIGSRELPGETDFFIVRKGEYYTSTSPNGRFIVAPNAGYGRADAPDDYKLATRGQNQGTFSEGEFTGISLYDRKLDSNSVLFKQSYTGEWSIGNIIWSDDSESIFFDNYGAVACIWKYTLNHRVLQKIVPEHEAHSPFFLRLDGRDYILYVDTVGRASETMVSRVMIATE
jgi:hypothetical protein